MRIDPRRRGRQSGPERRDACFSSLVSIYLHEILFASLNPTFPPVIFIAARRPIKEIHQTRKHGFENSGSRDYARTVDGGW